ncbi:oxidoreductase [Penicillium solitum]|uniref:Esterase mlcF n=1 Tax=Penicillium citrinum TaxID=5077 RepID=MLCF_PENCI|nr:RecName: Full=Esterase mlcF; AltName: Full=Compactin biosynthesis protein F [Penicillium citrinum]KAJ5870153.1 oxidoreductase [Penicillium solitum]BAC20563.1 oxidoreductase [Penicillium citrinum]
MSPARITDFSPGKPRKALLCIHGAGCSAAIFRVQISKLRVALKNEFEFVYATAPFSSSPGPGVLPVFQGMGPYYTWFQKHHDAVTNTTTPTVGDRVAAVIGPVQKTVQDWSITNPQAPIVGIVAFSEGALVATLLLHQQQMGKLPWFPKMSIAVLICCFYSDEARDYMRAEAQDDDDKLIINVPTLHLHGRQDFALQGSRQMVETHYLPQNADVLEFQGKHNFPNRPSDVQETVKRFQQLYQKVKMSGSFV